MAADEIDLRNEDRLPWLETVEPDEPERAGVGRVIVAILVGLLLVAAAAYAFTKLRNSASQQGDGQIIAAQEGDYKIKPQDPGGLKVKGEGDTAIATSAGAAGAGAIDLKAVPEAPITARRPAQPVPGTKAGGTRVASEVPASGGRLAATPPMQAPRAPVPGAASGGSLVQLGAFPTEAAANAAWSALAKRFGYVATLGKDVQQAEVNGRKVFRLRVNAGSANAASDICGRLKVAGEGCFVTS
jgi:hypothetical protein